MPVTDDEREELEALRAEAAAMREELEETNRGVVALTAELAERTRALEAADRRKDRFLALLGPALRTPLAVIDLVVDEVSPPERAQLLRRQVDHVRRLIDDLLDVSRVERGKITLDLTSVDLRALVDTTIEDARGVIEREGHRLEWAPPAEPVFVTGDPARLAQIIVNLLDNAVKYSPSGSRVTVALDVSDERVTLRVSDEGQGVDPEHQEHVFELFAQSDAARRGASGGLGIGLTLVRSLVELHAGEARLQSEGRGHGSTFTVELPRIAAPPPPAAPSSPPGRAAEAMRVLLVEDGDELRELLAARLRRRGLEVHTAADGAEALELLSEVPPLDAVVTDLGLPVIDGYELAEAVRETQPNLRLVALSGYGAPADRRRSAEVGFHAHLVKPVALDALLGALKGDARK